ncbi:MAG: hypothetical protein ACK56Y_03865 [Pseudanabaena sp.]
MIYTHKGYQCLLTPRITNQGIEWVAQAKRYSFSIEQKVFAQWCGTDLITSFGSPKKERMEENV